MKRKTKPSDRQCVCCKVLKPLDQFGPHSSSCRTCASGGKPNWIRRYKAKLEKDPDRLAHERLRQTWRGMIRRCHSPNYQSYAEYGGSGIFVCDEWRNSFEAFAAHMGHKPKGTYIDRINGKLGYFPGNCRWATPAESNRNVSFNRNITFLGKTQCLSDWAKEYGMKYRTLHNRLVRGKKTFEESIRLPVLHKAKP